MKYIWYNYFSDSKIKNLVSRYLGDIFRITILHVLPNSQEKIQHLGANS